MMEQELHFEHGDLTGEVSVSLHNEESLDDIFSKYIHDYNKDRFEAIAVRIFAGKENVITLYAADKIRQADNGRNTDKIPVKKFKIEGMSWNELLPFLSSFNCTLHTNNYPLEAMEVVNR
jgi:hypothetical protein